MVGFSVATVRAPARSRRCHSADAAEQKREEARALLEQLEGELRPAAARGILVQPYRVLTAAIEALSTRGTLESAATGAAADAAGAAQAELHTARARLEELEAYYRTASARQAALEERAVRRADCGHAHNAHSERAPDPIPPG